MAIELKIPGIREYVLDRLDAILNPKSVAVVGASRKEGKIGHTVVKNLIQGGFKGKIYPINPKADEILGLKAYPSLKDVPDEVDLAIIVVPAKITPQVIREAGEKGVKGLVVITAGFSEVGNKELEDEIVRIAREYKMPLIGPNVVGVLNANVNLNASFAQDLPYPGKIAFISQSGALVIGLIGWTHMYRVGISKIVSIGNKADVDFSELITYFAERDPETKVIAIYMEGTDAGRELVEATKRAMKAGKVVVILKGGRSKRGELATMSHTGSLAGSAKVYQAAFKQGYVIEVDNLTELYDVPLALANQPPAKNDNIIVITNGGGAGVLATDAAERYGIPLSDTPSELKKILRNFMPPFGSDKNPVDLTGQANEEDYYGAIVETAKFPGVGGIVALYCHTAITDPMKLAQKIRDAAKVANERGIPVTVSMIGGEEVERANLWLREQGVPAYPTPERAVRAMGALRQFGRYLEKIKRVS